MRPTPRTIIVTGIWLCTGILTSIFMEFFEMWSIVSIALLLLLIIDGLLLFSKSIPEINRSLPSALSLGETHQVTLSIYAHNDSFSKIQIYDHHPQSFKTEGLPYTVVLPDNREDLEFKIAYMVIPIERGKHEFQKTACLCLSPVELWQRKVFCGKPQFIRVYPNFSAVSRYMLCAVEGKTGQLGIRKLRRRGEGMEFHELREYRPGDSMRSIDWKSTSKYRKLISREYQEEKDQQIIFLLDCGFRMHTRDDELSHFDHTLNALLLLAYVALKQGDSIGLMTFGGQYRWFAPKKGVSSINHLLNTIYDLKTSLNASDISQAIEDVMIRLRKRSLIIVMSNIREEDTENLVSIMKTVSPKHLILAASLREKILSRVINENINNFKDALQVASAYHFLEQRQETQKLLKASGMLYFDEEPDNLPAALVNRYLDIKAKGLL